MMDTWSSHPNDLVEHCPTLAVRTTFTLLFSTRFECDEMCSHLAKGACTDVEREDLVPDQPYTLYQRSRLQVSHSSSSFKLSTMSLSKCLWAQSCWNQKWPFPNCFHLLDVQNCRTPLKFPDTLVWRQISGLCHPPTCVGEQTLMCWEHARSKDRDQAVAHSSWSGLQISSHKDWLPIMPQWPHDGWSFWPSRAFQLVKRDAGARGININNICKSLHYIWYPRCPQTFDHIV